jgi:raffinose/stachyose/melibiose transport system permease protein
MSTKKCKYLPDFFFLGIPVLLFLLIILVPLLMSIFYSLTDWDGISKAFDFVGLENYRKILSGKTTFMDSFFFTAGMSVISTVFTVIIGILLASALVGNVPGKSLLRLAFFLPNTLGGVVLGYVWRFILLIGIPFAGTKVPWGIFQIAWLGTPWSAFISIAIVSIWQGVGYVMIIMIAALVGVPEDLIESAVLDGASSARILFKIKLPVCMPYITVCIFWILAQTFKMFDLNVALTNGGPYGSTVSMALQIYRDAFTSNRYSLANAEGVIFFLILFAITALQLILSKKKEALYGV